MKRKEDILSQLRSTSNGIASIIDKIYSEDIDNIAEEIVICYNSLNEIINREDQTKTSDADFQSALLFWTALNTILSAVELFRRGYSKEPQMLLRNTLEIFSAAFDIHLHPKKFDTLQKTPERFDSTKCISAVKEIHPVIGMMYGQLSANFSHVGALHTLPHKSLEATLTIGGLYDPDEQKHNVFTLSVIMLTLEVLSSVLEFTFFDSISVHRHWTKADQQTFHFTPDPAMKAKHTALMDRMKVALDLDEVGTES